MAAAWSPAHGHRRPALQRVYFFIDHGNGKLLKLLSFTPTMFKGSSDIIKTNILSEFELDWVKAVAASVLTRFY